MLALDPRYKLRKTKTNIYFYRFDSELMDLQDQKILHPNTAILLTFFNGLNSTEEIKSAMGNIFGIHEIELSNAFDRFTSQWHPFMIDVSTKVRSENPNDFIIPAQKIDLTMTICESPLYLGISTTKKCMANCVYCYADRSGADKNDEMDAPKMMDILQQAKNMGVEYIMLSGGDPFMRSDIFRMIEFAIRSNIAIQLSTKKPLSVDEISKLKDIGLSAIQLSVDCADDKTSEIMTRMPHHASRQLKAIERLRSMDINVSTNSVVTNLNIEKIPELLKRLSILGVSPIRLSQYIRSAYNHSDDLFVTPESSLKLREHVNEFNSHNSVNKVTFSNLVNDSIASENEKMESFLNRGQCSAGRLSFMILANGKVTPCEQLPCDNRYILGDVNESTLQEIWDSFKVQELIFPNREHFQTTACYQCDNFDLCIYKKGWCVRDVWKAYGVKYQVQPQCPKSRATPGKRLY
jgi:radical SAM protein with 4Fe4S-binding SPASM domain